MTSRRKSSSKPSSDYGVSKDARNSVPGVAAASGQTSETTRKAIAALVPAVVGALASKTSTPADAAEMIRTLQRTGLDGTRFTSAASILESSGGVRDLAMMGGSLVFAIFGERTNAVTDWLVSRAGIGRRSSLSLLTLLVPLIVNVGLDAGGRQR